MTPPLTPIEAAEKLESLAEFFETAKGGWRDNDAALLHASASLLRQMSGALEWYASLDEVADAYEVCERLPSGAPTFLTRLNTYGVRARTALKGTP